MRYIVAIAAAFLVLMILGGTTGFGDWPRPWGPLSRGAVGGIVAIGILIIWEQMSPRPDSLRDDERADADEADRASENDDRTDTELEHTGRAVDGTNLDRAWGDGLTDDELTDGGEASGSEARPDDHPADRPDESR